MFSADDAEMLGSDRLSMFAHRRQQLGDALAVDLLDTKRIEQAIGASSRPLRAPCAERLSRKGRETPEGTPGPYGAARDRGPSPHGRRDNVGAASRYTNAPRSDCAVSIFSKPGPSRRHRRRLRHRTFPAKSNAD